MKLEINTMLNSIVEASRCCVIIEISEIRYHIPNNVFNILLKIKKSVAFIEMDVIEEKTIQLLFFK